MWSIISWENIYELIRSYNIIDRIPRPRGRTFIILECVAVTSSSVISLPPWLSCESSLRTHWTMNSFWKLKPLIDDGGGISPAGLIYPGIWVRQENRSRNRERERARETRLLPAADYHPGMFIKSYDSFRQFLSFIRLKVRLGCRSDCALFASPLTSRTYTSSISFINFRNFRTTSSRANSSYQSYISVANSMEFTSFSSL